MANNDHRDVELHVRRHGRLLGDAGARQRARASNETIDRIYEIGATVITAKDAPIHASGHGCAGGD